MSIYVLFVFVCTCPPRYYTDFNYPPVRLIAQASLTGHGTNVIAGMSVGVWDRIMLGSCGMGFMWPMILLMLVFNTLNATLFSDRAFLVIPHSQPARSS